MCVFIYSSFNHSCTQRLCELRLLRQNGSPASSPTAVNDVGMAVVLGACQGECGGNLTHSSSMMCTL